MHLICPKKASSRALQKTEALIFNVSLSTLIKKKQCPPVAELRE